MNKGQRAWLAVIIFTVSQVCAPQAHAGLIAVRTSSAPQSFTTGTWKVAPVATNASTGPLAAYSMSGIARSTSTTQGTYFSIRNLGTLQTISMTISQTTTGTGSYTVPVQYCTGTWTETTGACSGTVTTVFTNSNASTNSGTLTLTLAPNAAVRMRVQYVSTATRTVASSISVSVTRANVRTATSTNA